MYIKQFLGMFCLYSEEEFKIEGKKDVFATASSSSSFAQIVSDYVFFFSKSVSGWNSPHPVI